MTVSLLVRAVSTEHKWHPEQPLVVGNELAV